MWVDSIGFLLRLSFGLLDVAREAFHLKTLVYAKLRIENWNQGVLAARGPAPEDHITTESLSGRPRFFGI